MASRRFFVHDPYDHYYTATPYSYLYEPYYQRQSAPTRRARDIFAGAEQAAAKARSAPRATETQTSFSIPVHGPDSPERERKAAEARTGPMAPAMSAEDAAARMQAAARGFLARKSVRAVRQVDREAEQVGGKMACEAEALLADPRARVAVWEALMRMLLRLDAVRGARDYRRRVAKRVVALQDAVDAFGTKPAPAVEMAEESAVAPELPDAAEHSNGMESIKTTVHMPTQMEVSEAIAAFDGVDVTKVMQMVAALCEQSAQQCAVISALAERVDALERSVRRMDYGGRRTPRAPAAG